MNPDEDVGHRHELEVGLLRVGEEHLSNRNRKLNSVDNLSGEMEALWKEG